ncbi:DinB/UmuC family translesion DNA polymerase [Streptomyces sp. KR55]|uniref:DinB/UmuC family translesion DNA polymerase n=1 Tax=Streptomyces sp. KR55 TaxID=3457425 RepID=UPI003FCF3730
MAERARGHDPRPVVPAEPAAHLIADVVLERDCLDPARHHRAVLGLADQIGQRLRGESQIASRLTLTVRYADRSSTTRTRTLPEPTNHSPALATDALSLLAGLGLQRARVRAFVIRADNLLPANRAYRQLSSDPGDARARAAEAAADRARRVGFAGVRAASFGVGRQCDGGEPGLVGRCCTGSWRLPPRRGGVDEGTGVTSRPPGP